jgi:hypothetical protein
LVCSEMISDMDGMPQPYGSAQQLAAVFVAVADSPLIAHR